MRWSTGMPTASRSLAKLRAGVKRCLLAGRFVPQEGPLLTLAKERLAQQTAMFYWEIRCRICADGKRHADPLPFETIELLERTLRDQVEQLDEIIILEQELGQFALVKLGVPNSQLIVQQGMQATAYALQRLLQLHTGWEPVVVMSAMDNRDPGLLAADMLAQKSK